MNTYGQKGGTGATAGKKAETIAACGYSARVFFGQRIIVVTEARHLDEPLVRTAISLDEALEWCSRSSNSRWFWAETVNGQPFTPPKDAP